MGNSEPLTTRLIFGTKNDGIPFNLDLDTTTIEQEKICYDLFNLVGEHSSINILNSPYDFIDINCIIISGVDLENVDIDYSVLSSPNKIIVDEFVNLINSLTQ